MYGRCMSLSPIRKWWGRGRICRGIKKGRQKITDEIASPEAKNSNRFQEMQTRRCLHWTVRSSVGANQFPHDATIITRARQTWSTSITASTCSNNTASRKIAMLMQVWNDQAVAPDTSNSYLHSQMIDESRRVETLTWNYPDEVCTCDFNYPSIIHYDSLVWQSNVLTRPA